MENNNEVILKKIPLKILLDILTDAWDNGADYIDLMGTPDQIQDSIAIAVREEYYSKDEGDGSAVEDEYNIEIEETSPKTLDDIDLTDLI